MDDGYYWFTIGILVLVRCGKKKGPLTVEPLQGMLGMQCQQPVSAYLPPSWSFTVQTRNGETSGETLLGLHFQITVF